MRRINFGLESGSQALLDRMDKGTSVEGNSQFIRDAFEAGLSIRSSMFKGYPGETADDMEKTASFLESHSPYLDRIRFSDFSLLADTPIYKIINGQETEITGFKVTRKLKSKARSDYIYNRTDQSAYAKALTKVLRIVHDINRRPIGRPPASLMVSCNNWQCSQRYALDERITRKRRAHSRAGCGNCRAWSGARRPALFCQYSTRRAAEDDRRSIDVGRRCGVVSIGREPMNTLKKNWPSERASPGAITDVVLDVSTGKAWKLLIAGG